MRRERARRMLRLMRRDSVRIEYLQKDIGWIDPSCSTDDFPAAESLKERLSIGGAEQVLLAGAIQFGIVRLVSDLPLLKLVLRLLTLMDLRLRFSDRSELNKNANKTMAIPRPRSLEETQLPHFYLSAKLRPCNCNGPPPPLPLWPLRPPVHQTQPLGEGL